MGFQIPPELGDMILGMLRQINDSEEFFLLMASMSRKLFNALIEVGFTEDQAIKIVAGFAASKGK